MTGGRYFRATDKEKLKAVYDEINQLEKSKIEVMEHISYHELFSHGRWPRWDCCSPSSCFRTSY